MNMTKIITEILTIRIIIMVCVQVVHKALMLESKHYWRSNKNDHKVLPF